MISQQEAVYSGLQQKEHILQQLQGLKKKTKTTHPPTRDSFRGGKLCKTDLQSEFISNLCLIVVDETMTPGLFATSDVFLCL